ncbi:hypothetical protein EMPS_01836 [Entomortierella parvispora]|uniref:Uncharacterized protein n=1 Tax=Entomortierella parvispora TaxID=205924 RepID=A0A9P3LTC1_9FUNG|nr:hypothetical protein EMPS_01836 [Entomortierella parvispora]
MAPPVNTGKQQGDAKFSLQEAIEAGSNVSDEFHQSARTKINYSGNVKRANEFLMKQIEEGELSEEYRDAFKDVKACTPSALYLYISYLSGIKKYTYKTVEGVRSALKSHFDDMGFKGDDWKETRPGVWQGNPVFEHQFAELMKSLKQQSGRSGTSRQSLPMSYKDMAKLMAHLQEPTTIEKHGLGACLMFQAFAATGFTLWTTNEELVGLQGKDISSMMRTDSGQPYFTITLTFRKTNQADEKRAHVYEIHPTPSEPDSCCFTKLLAWLDWLEAHTHRRPGPRLGEGDGPTSKGPVKESSKDAKETEETEVRGRGAGAQEDYVFPALDTKGRVRVRDPMTNHRVQEYLDIFTNNSMVLGTRRGKFTSHCFRRGGAQFRFMFAKKKWSLKAVKWWGGWSETEKSGTIIRYLLDEYAAYEESFGDMLSPERDDSRHALFMGGDDESTEEGLDQRALSLQMQSIASSLQALDRKVSFLKQEVEDENRRQLRSLGGLIVQELGKTITNLLGSALQGGPVQTLQVPQSLVPIATPAVQTQQVDTAADEESVAPRIPNVKTWKDCITQWEQGDPENNLLLPLRHWTKAMRKTDPSRYSQRKLITNEYNRLHRNEENMMEVHGETLSSIHKLIQSIRDVKKARAKDGGGSGSVDGEEEEEEEEELVPARKRQRN